jgi:hypothetical protein
VALGKQYVDVWKNANELGKTAGAAALALCNGGKMDSLKLPDGLIDPTVAPAAGLTSQPFTTPAGNKVSSFILQPTPLLAEDLQKAIDGQQITKAELCKGVDASRRRGLQVAKPPARVSSAPPGPPGAQLHPAP